MPIVSRGRATLSSPLSISVSVKNLTQKLNLNIIPLMSFGLMVIHAAVCGRPIGQKNSTTHAKTYVAVGEVWVGVVLD